MKKIFLLVNSVLMLTSIIQVVNADPTPIYIDSCQTISSAGQYELTQDISSPGTCITITASNVDLDCKGFTITWDTDGGYFRTGIEVVGSNNVSIKNCNLVASGNSLQGSVGIVFENSSNGVVMNNAIQTGGVGEGNNGIELRSGSNDNQITNNIIDTNGSLEKNKGIVIVDSSGNEITLSTISTNGLNYNFGIGLVRSTNNTISENTITTNGSQLSWNQGIFGSDNSNFNTFLSNTIVANGGVGIALSSSNNNLASLNNITSIGEGVILGESDFNTIDNNTIESTTRFGVFIVPGSDNIITNNTINTNGPGFVSAVYIQGGARNRVEGNTLIVDDQGERIIDISGDAVGNKIINNILEAAPTAVGIEALHIRGDAHQTIVERNTITAHEGIVVATDGNLIDNNTIQTSAGLGIRVSNTGNTISNNSITATGKGIHLMQSMNGNILKNTISTDGTSNNQGFRIEDNSSNNTIEDTQITTSGNFNNQGLSISGNSLNNTFLRTTINTSGSGGNTGIRMTDASNNHFKDTVINNSGGVSSSAIFLVSSQNNTFENTLLDNPVEWIQSISPSPNNQFTNTTFQTPDGSIRYPGTFVLSVPKIENIVHAFFDITSNRAFLKSSVIPELNISAQITLNNITFSIPAIEVDFEDDGTFVLCNSPQCKIISFIGNTLVFDVLGFTTYRAAEVLDSDGDGIPDTEDSCPLEDATGFDADLDGCIDTVVGLQQTIDALPDGVLSDEIKNSLVSKVNNALKSVDKEKEKDNEAINMLNAFINEIEAQRGKKISEEVADMLIAYANNVIAKIEEG